MTNSTTQQTPAAATPAPRRSGKARWFRFAVLVMAGGTIYKLANIKDAFYVPMQQDLGLNNTEIGMLLSVNSIVATALFVVGGILADRISTRFLIPAGLIGAGALGVYISTFPGYGPLLITFAALAICSDCLLWPALLKSVRHLGGKDEQGRMFGLLEAGRGVIDTIVAFGALGVFALLGSGSGGFRGAILFYAIIDIVVGILVFLLLRDAPKDASAPVKTEPAGLRTILQAARMPQLWWVSVTVFMVYIVYCGLTYFIPYLTYVYGLPVAFVGAYGIINQYGLKILGGPTGGFLTDKVFKSASRYLRWAFIALIPVAAVIILLPAGPATRVPAMIATLMFSLVIFSMRGVFWAPMAEVGIPEEVSGTAFGIASLVGYAPGMFAFVIYGAILDANPGAAGYHIVFVIMASLALVGAGVATVLTRIVRRQKASAAAS
ncbi:MFS transporter [Microbacterium capsulatum]|uniref:MFS transporter n=1 Tax=Microbacterium capsulatum TaxID=3041921 RepID=A0ABU0XH04_9MICO|nr:MFS transporter [Microbacterium sp. ASV81]MDQ4214407.1 MFS transporter [Microbacterium sp. ASV81]